MNPPGWQRLSGPAMTNVMGRLRAGQFLFSWNFL